MKDNLHRFDNNTLPEDFGENMQRLQGEIISSKSRERLRQALIQFSLSIYVLTSKQKKSIGVSEKRLHDFSDSFDKNDLERATSLALSIIRGYLRRNVP